MFIAIEGIDGSGKTTLAGHLKEDLEGMGQKVFLTREPTDSFSITEAESARHDVETAIELFFRFTSDRYSHQRTISGNLAMNRVVITDRYLASSLAYQGALIEPVFGSAAKTVEWMEDVSRIITVRPDITIYVDVDPETAISRISGRSELSGFEQIDYLTRVREYYRLALGPGAITLDGSMDEDSVRKKALEALSGII